MQSAQNRNVAEPREISQVAAGSKAGSSFWKANLFDKKQPASEMRDYM
jgi:hypothetical protein